MTNGRRRFAKTVAGAAVALAAGEAAPDMSQPPNRDEIRKMMANALKEAYEAEIGQNFHAILSRKVDAGAMSRFVNACELVTRTYLSAWKRLVQTNVPSG
jgi:hypothetical protein